MMERSRSRRREVIVDISEAGIFHQLRFHWILEPGFTLSAVALHREVEASGIKKLFQCGKF